jgi:hypothetical protein
MSVRHKFGCALYQRRVQHRELWIVVECRRLQRLLNVGVFVGGRVHEPVFNVRVQIIDCAERLETDNYAGRIRNGHRLATADGDRHRRKSGARVKSAQCAKCSCHQFVHTG